MVKLQHLDDDQAQQAMVGMHITGQGVERDATKAKDWLTKAVEQGHKDSLRVRLFSPYGNRSQQVISSREDTVS